MAIYGYCRISTAKQSIDRQIRNIKEQYSEAVIVKEVYTGTKFQGRKELDKLISHIKRGETIVFDSLCRMSRNADEGVGLYKELYNKGIALVFLKEPYVNTDIYKKALESQIAETGNEIADEYIKATNKVLLILAERQIRIAFEQAEKEVDDLHKRTSEGMRTAKLNGRQIGRIRSRRYETQKSREAKSKIIKYSRDFEGSLSDIDVIRLTGVAKNTFYKYKRELLCDMMENGVNEGCDNEDDS